MKDIPENPFLLRMKYCYINLSVPKMKDPFFHRRDPIPALTVSNLQPSQRVSSNSLPWPSSGQKRLQAGHASKIRAADTTTALQSEAKVVWSACSLSYPSDVPAGRTIASHYISDSLDRTLNTQWTIDTIACRSALDRISRH